MSTDRRASRGRRLTIAAALVALVAGAVTTAGIGLAGSAFADDEPGFLTTADLSDAGEWTTRPKDDQIQVFEVPHCAGTSGLDATVYNYAGPTVSFDNAGSAGQDWILTETTLTLDEERTEATRNALDALVDCEPMRQASEDIEEKTFYANGSAITYGKQNSDGMYFIDLVTLSGNTMIKIATYVYEEDGSFAPIPGGPDALDWMQSVGRTARERAANG